MKKICFYSGDITNSGGTERVAIIIANELNKLKEYEVSFLSLVEKEKEPFFEISNNIKRYTIYDYVVRGITHIGGIIRRTRKFLVDNDVDILIDIDGILEMYTIPATIFTKVKVISWEHYNFYQNPVVPYRKYTRRMAARWASAIVTLTEEDKNYYSTNLKVRCPIKNIYNPIIWKENDSTYNGESKIILSVGRLTHQKGFDILIDVAKLFLKKYSEWKWIVLGEGEDRDLLERKIIDNDLENQIKLLGNVSDIDKYYESAAMFVMTSRFEGLPMTLLETKPYRLPIVSFNCKTGPSELIEDNVNGYLIPEGNIKMMAESIENLINDKNLRVKFSNCSTKDIEKFELQSILEKWKELLDII